MKNDAIKLKTVFLAFFAILMVWFLGVNQIIEMKEYAGMRELRYSSGMFFSLCYIILLLYIFFKCNQNTPQFILIGILLFYSFIWFFAFYSISGYTDYKFIFFGGLIFFLPIFSLYISGKYLEINYEFKRAGGSFFKLRVEIVITVLLVLTAILMYNKMGISFSFADSYERRMRGREVIDGFLAYLFAMSLNGLSPLLAFLAIYNRRYLYLIITFVFVFLGFGFVGTKAPIAYVVLMSLIGYYFVKGGCDIVYLLVIAMAGLIFLALLEYLLFGFSWIADTYIRRAILMVPQLQMYFLDFMFGDSYHGFSFLTGLKSTSQITFLIGDLYLGGHETINANTISFLTELGGKGIFGYFFSILFLVFYFNFLEYMYKASKHKVWLAIASIYSLLLLEQSFSIAFVSSGIGLCTILLILFNYQRDENSYD